MIHSDEGLTFYECLVIDCINHAFGIRVEFTDWDDGGDRVEAERTYKCMTE